MKIEADNNDVTEYPPHSSIGIIFCFICCSYLPHVCARMLMKSPFIILLSTSVAYLYLLLQCLESVITVHNLTHSSVMTKTWLDMAQS